MILVATDVAARGLGWYLYVMLPVNYPAFLFWGIAKELLGSETSTYYLLNVAKKKLIIN